jgi:hypothetical protein
MSFLERGLMDMGMETDEIVTESSGITSTEGEMSLHRAWTEDEDGGE